MSKRNDDLWGFVPEQFNGNGESQQLGSIYMPNGQWFAAVESMLGLTHEGHAGVQDDLAIIDQVVAVLNRELPGDKPRKRKAQVKQ